MRILISAILCLSIFAACTSSQNQQTDTSDFDTTEENEFTQQLATVFNNMDAVRLGDTTSFPYVYQGPGQSNLFEAYSMRFILRYDFPLTSLTNEKVSWVNSDNYNANNGFFVTYVRNGRQLNLNNPYIQVQYINKSLAFCGTVDSVYQWLDDQFLKFEDAQVLKDNHPVKTFGGDVAVMKNYRSTAQNGRKPKHLSYAYIDYNEEYIVGFGLTTMNQNDYETTLPLFDKLVKSFRRF